MSLFFLLPSRGTSPNLTLSVTDSTPSGSNSGFAVAGVVGSNVTAVSVTENGTGSYTYQWTQTGTPADDGPFSAASPNGSSTAWNKLCFDSSSQNTEQWRCTVTDTGNGLTGSIFVLVTLIWVNLN